MLLIKHHFVVLSYVDPSPLYNQSLANLALVGHNMAIFLNVMLPGRNFNSLNIFVAYTQ